MPGSFLLSAMFACKNDEGVDLTENPEDEALIVDLDDDEGVKLDPRSDTLGIWGFGSSSSLGATTGALVCNLASAPLGGIDATLAYDRGSSTLGTVCADDFVLFAAPALCDVPVPFPARFVAFLGATVVLVTPGVGRGVW